MIRKAHCSFAIVVLLLAAGLPALAQQLQADPKLAEKATELFSPEDKLAGPGTLRFVSDVRMHAMGFEMRHFDYVVNGTAVARVSHVKSVLPKPPASQVEYLVRFAKDGSIYRIVSLQPWKIDDKEVNVRAMLFAFEGQQADEMQAATILLANSLAMAGKTHKLDAPQPPPPGTVLNLEQKILEPGAKLPPLTMTDIDGKKFSAKPADLGGKPLVMVFCSTAGRGSPAMIESIEEIAKWKALKDKFHLVYVVTGNIERVKAYREQAKLSGVVVADEGSNLSKLLKVPFKPYSLMFEPDGVLKYNAYFTDQKQLAGCIYMLVVGKPPEKIEDVQPE